jgi:hypothetical protein
MDDAGGNGHAQVNTAKVVLLCAGVLEGLASKFDLAFRFGSKRGSGEMSYVHARRF